jgi:hypothetical protein
MSHSLGAPVAVAVFPKVSVLSMVATATTAAKANRDGIAEVRYIMRPPRFGDYGLTPSLTEVT